MEGAPSASGAGPSDAGCSNEVGAGAEARAPAVAVASASGGLDRTMSAQDDYRCPICMEPLTEPVTLQCGHVFCLEPCMTKWAEKERKCPVCRQELSSHPLRVNVMLRDLLNWRRTAATGAGPRPPSPSRPPRRVRILPHFNKERTSARISFLPEDAVTCLDVGPRAVRVVGSLAEEPGRRAWLVRLCAGCRLLVGVVSEAWSGPLDELPAGDDRARFAALGQAEVDARDSPRFACGEGQVIRIELSARDRGRRLWIWAPTAAANSPTFVSVPEASDQLCLYLYPGTVVSLVADLSIAAAAGVPRPPLMELVGKEVVPGPDWPDEEVLEGRGVVSAVEHEEGWVSVRWAEREERRRWGADGLYDLALAPTAAEAEAGRLCAVPLERLVGRRVERGAGWRSRNDDGGPGAVGSVCLVAPLGQPPLRLGDGPTMQPGTICVRWCGGDESLFRWGRDGSSELRTLPGPQPAATDPCIIPPELLVGLRCIRGPSWKLADEAQRPALADLPANLAELLPSLPPSELGAVCRRHYDQEGTVLDVWGKGRACWLAVRWEGDPSPVPRTYRWVHTRFISRIPVLCHHLCITEEPRLETRENAEGRPAHRSRNGHFYCGAAGVQLQCTCDPQCVRCGPDAGCSCAACGALDAAYPAPRSLTTFDDRRKGAKLSVREPGQAVCSWGPCFGLSQGSLARGSYAWRLDNYGKNWMVGVVDDSFDPTAAGVDIDEASVWKANFVRSSNLTGYSHLDQIRRDSNSGHLVVSVDTARRVFTVSAPGCEPVEKAYVLPGSANGQSVPVRLAVCLWKDAETILSRERRPWRWSSERKSGDVVLRSSRKVARSADAEADNALPLSGALLDSFLDPDWTLPHPDGPAPPGTLGHAYAWVVRAEGPGCRLAIVDDDADDAAVLASPPPPLAAAPVAAGVVEVRVDFAARTFAIAPPNAAGNPLPLPHGAARLNLCALLPPGGAVELLDRESLLPAPTAGATFDTAHACMKGRAPAFSNCQRVFCPSGSLACPILFPPGTRRAVARIAVTRNTRFWIGAAPRAQLEAAAPVPPADLLPFFFQTQITSGANAKSFHYDEGSAIALTLDLDARSLELQCVSPFDGLLQTLRAVLPLDIDEDELVACVVIGAGAHCSLIHCTTPAFGSREEAAAACPAHATEAHELLGSRVRRGPSWVYGGQDGGKGRTGRVFALVPGGTKGNEWLAVHWDTGEANAYRWGAEGFCYDLTLEAPAHDLTSRLTCAELVGKRVGRGRSWKWGDQDGGPGSLGLVDRVSKPDGWVHVLWHHAAPNSYRWGYEGHHDLLVLDVDGVPPELLFAGTLPTAVQIVGRTVRRGPDWRWDDQDGGEGRTGVVVSESTSRPGWVSVRWEASGRDNHIYRWGAESRFDLALVDDGPAPAAGPSLVSEAAKIIGRRVKRGPDWKWEDQDGGLGTIGLVVALSSSPGWVRVAWPDTGTNGYRYGAEGKFDLELVQGAGPSPPATHELVGRRVVRGPDWKWGDQDGGPGGVGEVTGPDDPGWVIVRWASGASNGYRWGADGMYDLALLPERDREHEAGRNSRRRTESSGSNAGGADAGGAPDQPAASSN